MEKKIKVKKEYIILIVLIILIVIGFYKFVFLKDCKGDMDCFNEYSRDCKRARVFVVSDGNVLEYKVLGSEKENCVVSVKMEKMKEGSELRLVKAFQGKSMECKIAKEILKERSLETVDNLIDYCSGELKEAMQEIIIKRMYTFILSNLKDIVDQLGNLTKVV